MMAGTLPIPNKGINNPSNAKDGIVCSTALIPIIVSAIFFLLVK